MGFKSYTPVEILEQQWQRRLDVVARRIKVYVDITVNNIRIFIEKHEAIKHNMFKYHSYKKEKEKWFFYLERYKNSRDKFGPFDTKKQAKEYLEKHHVIYLTFGTLFKQLKQSRGIIK